MLSEAKIREKIEHEISHILFWRRELMKLVAQNQPRRTSSPRMGCYDQIGRHLYTLHHLYDVLEVPQEERRSFE